LLRSGVAIFDLDYDAIFDLDYDYSALRGTAPAEALHTFMLDSGASRCFFCDSTTLTPLLAPVPVRLANLSGGPVLARFSTVLPYPAVLSGSLSGLHLPSFSTNLVSTAALLDVMVTTTTLGGQRVSICTCTWTCHHLAMFTRRPGSSLYTLATEPPQVAASARVSVSGPVAPLCSCRLLSHQTLLWHHRLGHPSLPRLRGMHSRLLVSGLPRSLPPLPPSPAPPCLPCIEGWKRAAPHSSFPSTTAPLQSLHMDVWGPARVSGLGRERYFLLVVDDYMHDTTVFPLRSKGEDLPVLHLHSVRGGEFSSDFLPEFSRGEGILQSVTLPASPQPNEIAERRIGLVMEVGDASVFQVWGSRAFVRDRSADKLSSRAIPCVFLGFPPDAHGWQWQTPSPPRVMLPHSGGAEPVGAEPAGAEPAGAEPWGAEPEGVEPGGAESEGEQSRGAEPRAAAAAGDTEAGGVGLTAGAGGTRGAAAAGPGGARTRGTGAAGTGSVGGAGAGGAGARDTGAVGAGAGGIGAGGAGAGRAGAGDTGTVDPGAGGAGARGAVSGGTGAGGIVWPRPFFVPLLQQPPLQPASPQLAPSPYTEQTGGLTERREPESSRASPVRTVRTSCRAPRPRPPLVPDTRAMALRPSSVPLRSTAASALVAKLVDFTFACRLDYAIALVAESEFTSPPSIGRECALCTDVLEDRQEDVECLVAAVPHFASMLLAPKGDLDAPDIPTPRSYAEAITGPYSSQWQAAMDAEMASWKSTGTYVDAVPPSRANIVDGMWIFRVKRPPGSLPTFKARYVARGFSQRQGVNYFQTFSPTPKKTTLRDYTCDYTTPSTADPSLFLCTDTSLPPFYVLVYVDDLVFATADTEALTLVKLELQKRHTCTDLGELLCYLGLQITRDRARGTITQTLSHMVHQVRQRFGFQFSSPQPTPLSTSHLLSAPPLDKSVEPSGPYPELVGCLMYMMTCIRTDLAYPLNLLACYVAPGKHRKVHWDAAKRVLRYLCSTSGMGLMLGGRGPVVISGHASLLGSRCEGEIYARAMAAQELLWLTYLLTDLGEQPRSPPRGQLRLAYVATWANAADIFTKALQSELAISAGAVVLAFASGGVAAAAAVFAAADVDAVAVVFAAVVC
ncbi:unnamed protein product, partial [Closterium sp. NIES-53]